MKTSVAPGVAWEVRLEWGARPLAAEVVSAARPRLALGNRPGDDVDTGHPARLELELGPDATLALRFSPGVEGLAAVGGEAPATLGRLVELGRAAEAAGGFQLALRPGDGAELAVGNLSVHVRQARGRVLALPLDRRGLLALGVTLALLLGFLFTAAMEWESTLKYLLPRPRPAPARR